MVCDPNDNLLNPSPIIPPINVPGFGIPFGPPSIPFPDVELPEGIPEDILQFIEDLLTNIPGGPLVPNLPDVAKNVIDAIASLLNQLGPYLAIYRFFQALLNIILCIIDVLCAATNPWAMLRAIRRLFKRCLPDFLNLFPWLALLAMIIALLLLLLALIEYLIAQILALLNDIIENLKDLASAVGFGHPDRQLAGARKIAQLLCMIEQLFAILIALQALFAIIQALSGIGGRTICGKKGTSQGDDFGCCPDEVCPSFIFENPDGLTGTMGQLIYHNQANNDITGLGIPITLPPIREERWQFYDDETQVFNFADIITPVIATDPVTDGTNSVIFWPEGKTYESDASLRRVPYILDLRMLVNPAVFGHVDPIGTERFFRINNIVVIRKPTFALTEFDNSTSNEPNGVLRLEGGEVFEDDNTTPFLINGEQATLNDFIHFDSKDVVPPIVINDGYEFSDVEYTLRINHPALIDDSIITIGCDPTIQVETTILNANNDILSILQKIGDVPDIQATLDCLNGSLAKLRTDVTVENAQTAQEEMQQCLEDLRADTLELYENAVTEGADQFKTVVEIDPDVQFISLSIEVKVTLNDIGGTTITFNMPESVQNSIASKIEATPTLGEISNFVFDGYDSFVADLTSEVAGIGELTISFDGAVLSDLLNIDNDDISTEVQERVVSYRFVGRPSAGDADPVPRRDETDTGGS